MIEIFEIALLLFLITCALSVAFLKDMIAIVVVFASYSLIMAILWQLLEAPDIAITEAAVGAGLTTILFIATVRRTGGLKK